LKKLVLKSIYIRRYKLLSKSVFSYTS